MISDLSWINDDVCVGPGGLASIFEELKGQGVGLIINLEMVFHDEEKEVTREIGVNYLYCPVQDYSPPTQDQLDLVVVKMREAVDSGKKVYIHCFAGLGRSPTFVVAYLISRGKTIQDAINLVKEKRPGIWTRSGDRKLRDGALHEYDRRMSETKT